MVKKQYLYEGTEWDFEKIQKVYSAIEDVALNDLELDVYPNQIEIITSEQMLDAYSSIGMPLYYNHWSYGKNFIRDHQMYRKGQMGLAYEIVANTSPTINYLMEENTMTMQTLVLAHAAFGHNHFFKNNYMFREWTDASAIVDYLEFAQKYVRRCEEKYGIDSVERILDAAHALSNYGVDRYKRPSRTSTLDEIERQKNIEKYIEQSYNDVWFRTVPKKSKKEENSVERDREKRRQKLKLPEENILYFLEKNSPILETWQRELIRIVRKISTYFYPQRWTKVMNEGCATWVHHYIMNTLYDRGQLTDGAMLEFIHSHSGVVYQGSYERTGSLNPYALGFAMMSDIVRICKEPTDEDKEWFPEWAGNGDWKGTLKHAWANYRDESFIQQFLSPKIIRDFRLFMITDDASKSHIDVSAIHDNDGYRRIRKTLARSYNLSYTEPDIQVDDVDVRGDRCLRLIHKSYNGIPIDRDDTDEVLKHLALLWGYDVRMASNDSNTGRSLEWFHIKKS